MAFRIALAALLFLMVAGATSRAAEPAPIPLAVGLTESEAKERAALFAALAATKSDAEARVAEDRIWTFWRGFADEQSRQLLEQSKEAQLRFDYDEALIYLKELVKHAPQFAEG